MKSSAVRLHRSVKNGQSKKETGERLVFSKEQIKGFFKRHQKNQRKLAADIAIKLKGRPRKGGTTLPPSIQQLNRLAQLQYELARKERQIKQKNLPLANKIKECQDKCGKLMDIVECICGWNVKEYTIIQRRYFE